MSVLRVALAARRLRTPSFRACPSLIASLSPLPPPAVVAPADRRRPHGARRMGTKWLQQHRGYDVYAERAKAEGLRCRAAFKLMEIDEKADRFLQPVRLGGSGRGVAAAARLRVCEPPLVFLLAFWMRSRVWGGCLS